jgi:predicted porin
MKHRKTQVAAAVGAAMLIGASAAQAQTTPVSPSQPGLTVQLYGHVNRAVMFADNETQSKWFFVDGQPSSTRFGIDARGTIMPGLTAGARLETEIRSNRSNEVTFAVPATGSQSFTERFLEVFVGGAWGQINLGQGAGASDATMEVDLSGVDLALSNPMNDFGGAIPFTNAAGTALITLDNVSNNLDGLSRLDRLQYTTPTFGGFRFQASIGQHAGSAPAVPAGEAKEASIWWATKLLGDFQAAIGWAEVNSGPDRMVHVGGSASWLHSSGFNISGAYGQRELGTTFANREATHWNAQLGYKFRTHAIGLKYEVTEDLSAVGDEHTGIGVGYVWTPIRWAEFYASYMMHQLDRATGSVNDITVGAIGTRVRF